MALSLEEVKARIAARRQPPPDIAHPPVQGGQYAWEDGDSRALPGGAQTRVQGFDAPELAHPDKGLGQEPGAQESTQLSAQYAAQSGVQRTENGLDYYGRPLERYEGRGTTLAQEQLRHGLATPMDDDPANRRAFYEGLHERDNPSTPEQAALNRKLDAELKASRPNYHNKRVQKKRGLGEVFGDAIDRGLDQMGMMAGGTQKLLGEGLGIDALTEAGERRIRENQLDVAYNQPDVGTLSNVNTVGDGMTWAIEKLGEQGPNVAAMLGTALATGGVGTVLEVGTVGLAGEMLATRAAVQGLNLIGRAMTTEMGAVAAGATLNIGESKLNLDEADPNGDHNLLALATGALKTGLDVVSLGAMPGVGRWLMPRAKVLGLSPKDALKAWGDIPMGVVRATATEGSTEGLQELLDGAAANYKAGTPIDWAQVGEAAAAGALVGGVMGGVGGVAEVGLQKPRGDTSGVPAAEDTNNPADPTQNEVDSTEPVPETAESLQAQADAVADPNHERQMGFVPDGSPMPTLADGLRVRGVPGGQIYGAPETLAAFGRRAAELQNTEQALGEFLQGNPQSREQAIAQAEATGEAPVVARTVDAAGTPVTETVTPASQGEAAAAALPTGPGETTEVVAPEQVLAERVTETPAPVTETPAPVTEAEVTAAPAATPTANADTAPVPKPTGQSAWAVLHDRVRQLPWAKKHLLLPEDGSTGPVQVNGKKGKKARDWNNVALTDVAKTLRQVAAERVGLEVLSEKDYYGNTPQHAALMGELERMATLSNRELTKLLQSVREDNRYPMARIGRAKGVAQDQGVTVGGQVGATEENSGEGAPEGMQGNSWDEEYAQRFDAERRRMMPDRDAEDVALGTSATDSLEHASRNVEAAVDEDTGEVTNMPRLRALDANDPAASGLVDWYNSQPQEVQDEIGSLEDLLAGRIREKPGQSLDAHRDTPTKDGESVDERTERRLAASRRVDLDSAELADEAPTPEEAADTAHTAGASLVERLFGDTGRLEDAVRKIQARLQPGEQARAFEIIREMRDATSNKALRLLLSALLPFVQNTKFVVVRRDDKLMRDADLPLALRGRGFDTAGVYDPAANVIALTVGLGPSKFFTGVLHEAMHAASYNGLRNNKAFAAAVTALRTRAKRALKASKDERAKSTRAYITYGLKNNDEFVAQLFSSPEFIDFLDSVPGERFGPSVTPGSLLRDVVNALRRLLGLGARNTLAAEAMETVLREMAKGPQEGKTKGGKPVHLPDFGDPRLAVRRLGDTAAETAARTIDALADTAAGRAARFTAARQYREAGSALWGGLKTAGNFALDVMQPLLVANWDLRRVGSDALADAFFRQSGTRKRLGLMNRATLREMGFRVAWNRLFKGETPEAIAAAWTATERARAAGHTRRHLAEDNPLAGKIQDFFALVDNYVRSSGVKGYRSASNNGAIYLPQVHDIGAISQNVEGYIQFLVDNEFEMVDEVTGRTRVIDEQMAALIARNLTTPHGHAQHQDLPFAGSLMHRVITDPRYQALARRDGWLRGDPQRIVEFYLASVTKLVEFERRFGGHIEVFDERAQEYRPLEVERPRSTPDPEDGLERYDPDQELPDRLFQHLRFIVGDEIRNVREAQRAFDIGVRNGMIEPLDGGKFMLYERDRKLIDMKAAALAKYGTDAKARREAEARINLVISGYMGQLGADLAPNRRRAQQWVLAAQTVTTLAFSAVSSIPEFALIAATAPSRKALVEAVRKAAVDREATKGILEDIGYGWDQAINVALLDNSQYSTIDGLPRKIIDKFFVLNGQHLWTHAMRAITVQMALSHFNRLAEANDTTTLRQHGLTPDLVRDWMQNRQMHGIGTTNFTQAELHPVVEAIHTFVDDRVIMPDAASRPTFMNDPRWALVSQLKSFFYAYGSKVIGGMARRQAASYQEAMARGDRKAAALVKAATPYLVLGVLGMGLAALAGELRDKLKYDIWGEEPPKWREKHGLDYWLYAMRQSGVLGPMDMAVNLFSDQSSGVVGLLGPAAGHLEVGLKHGFFSQEFATRSTPVLAQLPGARAKLAELFETDDGL